MQDTPTMKQKCKYLASKEAEGNWDWLLKNKIYQINKQNYLIKVGFGIKRFLVKFGPNESSHLSLLLFASGLTSPLRLMNILNISDIFDIWNILDIPWIFGISGIFEILKYLKYFNILLYSREIYLEEEKKTTYSFSWVILCKKLFLSFAIIAGGS